MLKFLSKVKIEFNALDPRVASCMEFLAQCNARKAKESNPACQVLVKRRTDDFPPQITVTFVNGVEEAFDATSTPAQSIRTMILEKGQLLETEQMFREAGEKWPVIIPEEELHQFAPGTKFFGNAATELLLPSSCVYANSLVCVFLQIPHLEWDVKRDQGIKLAVDAKEGRREEAVICMLSLLLATWETLDDHKLCRSKNRT
ncbi:hypothetical protein SADUNF_Sadunf01G0182700 [Salix dunnii]|uniref:Large ribosomal subunit protein mL53 n=1 Tax=Salix dunnii TaxID=1413687 RepID=A0A835TL60_9ROSI|nr:hypothetical protein SADUNF_Sadunf01G0182700 [Salix dunnii]